MFTICITINFTIMKKNQQKKIESVIRFMSDSGVTPQMFFQYCRENNIPLSLRKAVRKELVELVCNRLQIENQREVKNSSDFRQDLGADSLDEVEIVLDVERKFKVAIPDEQAEKITTFGDLVEVVVKKTVNT